MIHSTYNVVTVRSIRVLYNVRCTTYVVQRTWYNVATYVVVQRTVYNEIVLYAIIYVKVLSPQYDTLILGPHSDTQYYVTQINILK